MLLKKNTKVGKINDIFTLVLVLSLLIFSNLRSEENMEGEYTNIKVLDKISSKNTLIKLKNTEEIRYKDLLIKSLKCKNSEFDDNPEITTYLQIKDNKNSNNDEVFVFNGWTFSSSPSIQVFDHPVYDLWILKCY